MQPLSLRTQSEVYGKSELTPGTQGWASRTDAGVHQGPEAPWEEMGHTEGLAEESGCPSDGGSGAKQRLKE